VEGGYTGV